MRTRSVSLLAAVLLCAVSIACSTKEAVVDGLIGLQSAAITAAHTNGANGSPLLSAPDEIKIVTATTQALVTIQSGSSGWQAAVQTGWAAFVSDLPAADKAQFATPIAVVSGAIGGL